MKTVTYKVKIKNIKVDDKYYSFDWNVWREGELLDEGSYENDHEWSDDIEGWKEQLEESEAEKIALQQVFE